MPKRISRFLLPAAFLVSSVCAARAGAIIEGDTGDAMVDQTAVNDAAYSTTYDLNVGALYGGQISAMVEAFPLPYLAPGQQVTGVTISFYLEQVNSSPTYNVRLYGLNRVNAGNPAPLLSDGFEGTNDASNTLLDATFVTPATAVNQAVTYSGSNLVDFIQNQYANPAFSGMDLSNSRYIFFRLGPDGAQAGGGFSNYQFASARNPARGYHPTLTLTISNGIANQAGRLQFSFNLPQAATTSAGVYNTSTGDLIRTLWNNIRYPQGVNDGAWDGKDDGGNAVATDGDYRIKLIYHNVQYVWEGMIGNTSASQSGANVYHAFGKIHDMSVSGSTAFHAVGYNEQQNPFNTFTVGNPQAPAGMQLGGNFGDCFSCIYFVTSDAARSYWAKVAGGVAASDTYVIGINNGDNSFYAFPRGTAPSGSNQKYASCVDFDATPNQANPASGLAVQKSGNGLFVSHENLNLVRVFDKVQGNFLGSFTVPNPGRLAATANGDVWVISNAAAPAVLRYAFAKGTATLKQTITGLIHPAGLGVSADDALLLVSDGGDSQQIKAFNNATGTAVWTYGTPGGMAANGPNITTHAFNFNAQVANRNSFSNEAFIAFQPDNTFWVEDGGNGRVLHFSINGKTPVYIDQIAYIDASYRSTVDLTDATRVFNQFMEYSVNYALPPGGTNGSWKMVKNWSVGLPNDSARGYFGLRNGFDNVVTLSNGHTYGLLRDTITKRADLFELPASGPARFTGASFNNSPRIYADGSLRFNATNGNSTSLSFYLQPLTGFDSGNNPIWASSTPIARIALTPDSPRPWVTFPMRTEITSSHVIVDFDGNQAHAGYHLGGIPVGGNAFLWLASPGTTKSYTGWFPQDGRFDIGNGVQYAGNHAMALGRNIIYGYHGELWQGCEASQWVNFLDNGLMVGRFGVYGNSGTTYSTINGFAGNSFSPTLVYGPDGNAYLYHNDESNHGGTVRWRIDGWNGITELDATARLGAIANLSGAFKPAGNSGIPKIR